MKKNNTVFLKKMLILWLGNLTFYDFEYLIK